MCYAALVDGLALIERTPVLPYADAEVWLAQRSLDRSKPAKPSGNRLERRKAEALARAHKREPDYVTKHRKVASIVGKELWVAESQADFEDRLNDMLDDADLVSRAFGLLGFVQRARFPELETFGAFAAAIVTQTRDLGLLEELEHGARVASVITTVFAKGKEARNAAKEERAVKQTASAETNVWQLGRLPFTIRASILAGMRAALCMAALVDLATAHREPPAFLARLAVRGWWLGQKDYLPALATLMNTDDIPLDLLPATERLSVAQVEQQEQDVEEDFQRYIALNVA